jgi:hypothetical protein
MIEPAGAGLTADDGESASMAQALDALSRLARSSRSRPSRRGSRPGHCHRSHPEGSVHISGMAALITVVAVRLFIWEEV